MTIAGSFGNFSTHLSVARRSSAGTQTQKAAQLMAALNVPRPLAYGFVWGAGNKIAEYPANSNNATKDTRYVIIGLGEGEWDGYDAIYVNKKLFPAANIHFHGGTDGTLGAGLGEISTGGDQNVDVWFAKLLGLQPVTLSRLAYVALQIPFDPAAPTADLDVIGAYRGKKVRSFDNTGAQLTYAFSTNPVWQILDVLTTFFIQRTYTLNTALTAQEKTRINFPSFVTAAAYCDALINNGDGINRKRFESSRIFVQQTTVQDVLDALLMGCQGYLEEVNGAFQIAIDQARASTFILSDQHILAGSFDVEEQTTEGGADELDSAFNDLSEPLIANITAISRAANRYGTVSVTCSAAHGRAVGDTVRINNVSDNSFNVLATITALTNNQVFRFRQPGQPAATPAIGGTETVTNPTGKFAQQTKKNQHDQHQRSLGQRGAGLTLIPNPTPLSLDFGNCTPEMVERLTNFILLRTFGPSTAPYIAPKEARVKAFLDSVDANGAFLQDQLCGDIITIDRSVSEEHQGLYEIIEFTFPQMSVKDVTEPSGGGKELSVNALPASNEDDLAVELYLKQYVPTAFSDLAGPVQLLGPGSSLGAPTDAQIPANSAVIHTALSSGAAVCYRVFSLKNYTIVAGDVLEYDEFIDQDSVSPAYALDFLYNGGASALSGTAIADQEGFAASPQTDLGAKQGAWYHRKFDLSTLVGQTITQWESAWDLRGASMSAAGVMRGRIANVKVTNGGSLQLVVFSMHFFGQAVVGHIADAAVSSVTVFSADNGVLAVPAQGKNMLVNPGFEDNAVLATPGAATLGGLVVDGWTIGPPVGPAGCAAILEDNSGNQRTGLRNLILRLLQNVNVPALGNVGIQVYSDLQKVTGDDILAFGGYLKCNGAALPAGLSVQIEIDLAFYAPNFGGSLTNFIGTPPAATPLQITNNFGWTSCKSQAQVPSNAAYASVRIRILVSNSTGAAINTGANFYCDTRADDMFLINRTQAFDTSPVNSTCYPTNGANILTQHGTTTQIDVGSFTLKAGFGNVSFNSGSVDPGAYGKWYVYFDDPLFVGGAQAYHATQDVTILGNAEGRVIVGSITTLVGGGGTGGGSSGGPGSGGRGINQQP